MDSDITIALTPYGPIEYRREGTGPSILLLNGGHCSRSTRLSHEHLVSAGFTIVTPSRPGYDATPPNVGRSAQAAADALASLLDCLNIPVVAVIGISAAGPTALAFAQRHASRTSKLILESAVTTPWDAALKRQAHHIFGRTEKLTWTMLKLALRLMPTSTTKLMMQQFTTLPVAEVWQRMTQKDILFVQQMLRTMRSGTGFVLDLEHRVDDLQTITAPVLVMYSRYDKSVPPSNAERVAREVVQCEVYEVRADSHLIWIGPQAAQVWDKRLSFLQQ